MKSKDSVTIVVPAFNEEKNIEAAVKGVEKAAKGLVSDYEILVVDDGSTDKTGLIVKKLASRNKHIKLLRHKNNLGFGVTLRDGITKSASSFIAGFPGDNDMSWKSLREMIAARKRADLVSSYMNNPEKRSFIRRVVSKLYVSVMNFLFGLNIRYYNGYFICKGKLLQKLFLKSEGYTIFAEIKVRLLKQGVSFLELPFIHTGRRYGKSKATSVKSMIQTITNMFMLLWEVFYIAKD